MTIYLSLLVALIGLLVWALSNNVKLSKAGLYAWGAGLTAFLITFSTRAVNLFH